MTFVSASGCHFLDDAGQQWLDAGVSNALVGHAHPAVTEAVTRELQNGGLDVRTRERCIERLLEKFPSEYSICYLTNSLTEANELALRLARAHGAGKDVIVLDDAEHGMSTSLVNMGPERRKFWVQVASRKDAGVVAERAREIQASGRGVCGFFAEGVFDSGYLRDAYASVHAAGGLNIAIEAQTGMGRIGEAFWEFARHGASPDIVVVGESLANGLPLAAVVTRPEFAAPFPVDSNVSSVACAAANAVFDSLQVPEQALCCEIEGIDAARLREHRVLLPMRGSVGLFRPPLCWSAADAEWFLRASA